MLIAAVRYAFGARGRQALALADAAGASDGSWVLVRYDWGGEEGSPSRMPIVGMSSAAELVAALVEFGAEAVDASISPQAIDVKYTDELDVERRVGAKTPFETLRHARLITVRQRAVSEGDRVKQSLLHGAAGPEEMRSEGAAHYSSRGGCRGTGGPAQSRRAKGNEVVSACIAPVAAGCSSEEEEELVPEGNCSDCARDDAAARAVQQQL
jgi:hypothetical protein